MVYEHDKVIHLDDETFNEYTGALVGDVGHDFRNKNTRKKRKKRNKSNRKL